MAEQSYSTNRQGQLLYELKTVDTTTVDVQEDINEGPGMAVVNYRKTVHTGFLPSCYDVYSWVNYMFDVRILKREHGKRNPYVEIINYNDKLQLLIKPLNVSLMFTCNTVKIVTEDNHLKQSLKTMLDFRLERV